MRFDLNPGSIESYRLFLRAKSLPMFRCRGNIIEVPDEYAHLIDGTVPKAESDKQYRPINGLFDYQAAVSRLAIRKRKFALFIEPGYGKTLCYSEFAKYVSKVMPRSKCILWLAPSMVVRQTLQEVERFYGKTLKIDRIEAKDLARWLTSGKGRIGITNYEALKEDTPQGRLGCIIPDEMSCTRGQGSVWASIIIRLGQGVEWKLGGTGTPAPNDRIEYANYAVFLDQFPNVNAFYARYFVNRGQTNNRWELKPHAIAPFYRDLSAWSLFMTNPATYGFKDNCGTIPPIYVNIQDVEMTDAQSQACYELTGRLFMDDPGGITKRSKLSQIAKGRHNGQRIDTNKPMFIKGLVDSWPSESTIIWAKFNQEQDDLERLFPEAASIRGTTPMERRDDLVDDFKAGRKRVLITKPECAGMGMNFQIATRQIFSTLIDSYEDFTQCVKRSNRVGSTMPLNVHLPVSEAERPMVQTVLVKARRVQGETEEQERMFKESGVILW